MNTLKNKILDIININNFLSQSIYLLIKNKLNFIINNTVQTNNITIKEDKIIFNEYVTTLPNFEFKIFHIIMYYLYFNYLPKSEVRNSIKNLIKYKYISKFNFDDINSFYINYDCFFYRIDDTNRYIKYTDKYPFSRNNGSLLYIYSIEDLKIISNENNYNYIIKIIINDNKILQNKLNIDDNFDFKFFDIDIFEWLIYHTNIKINNIILYLQNLITTINNYNNEYYKRQCIYNIFNFIIHIMDNKQYKSNKKLIQIFLSSLNEYQILTLFNHINNENNLYIFFNNLLNNQTKYLFNKMNFEDKLQYSKYLKVN